ncbi:hypothetical protein GGI35DRAFT_464123 [Trichoderma velutinum]
MDHYSSPSSFQASPSYHRAPHNALVYSPVPCVSTPSVLALARPSSGGVAVVVLFASDKGVAGYRVNHVNCVVWAIKHRVHAKAKCITLTLYVSYPKTIGNENFTSRIPLCKVPYERRSALPLWIPFLIKCWGFHQILISGNFPEPEDLHLSNESEPDVFSVLQSKDEALVYSPKDNWDDPEYMEKCGYEWAPMKYKFVMAKDWYSIAVVSTVKLNSYDILRHAVTVVT